VQVPSVVGDDPAVAGQALAAAQLKVSKQTFEASTSIPAGQVTRTDPPAGATEPAGTPVVVYVSSGIEMPDLSNQTQSQAQSALSAANLTGQFTPQAVTDPRQNGLVIAQNPAAGTTGLQSGQTVQVTIGQYTAPSTTTSTSTTSTTVAGGGTG
jgi:serine/threonine-protein kinase